MIKLQKEKQKMKKDKILFKASFMMMQSPNLKIKCQQHSTRYNLDN